MHLALPLLLLGLTAAQRTVTITEIRYLPTDAPAATQAVGGGEGDLTTTVTVEITGPAPSIEQTFAPAPTNDPDTSPANTDTNALATATGTTETSTNTDATETTETPDATSPSPTRSATIFTVASGTGSINLSALSSAIAANRTISLVNGSVPTVPVAPPMASPAQPTQASPALQSPIPASGGSIVSPALALLLVGLGAAMAL